jgi:hypothetical protein
MSMKNSNDTIGNRTRDLPSCSAVLQPTAPPRAPIFSQRLFKILMNPLLEVNIQECTTFHLTYLKELELEHCELIDDLVEHTLTV